MKYLLTFILVLLFSSVSAKIKVEQSGLLKSESNNQACRAYGVNYFDVFHRLLQNGKDSDYRRGFSELNGFAIPFARFSAMGYWPKDSSLYFTDKEEYFRRLDLIFNEAEKNAIGLIPSLFFNRSAVPDLMKESVNSWSDPNSKTIMFMTEYVKDFMTRYSNHRALWAVEFSNEINLYTDLPNSSKFRPGINTAKGTPANRTQEDELKLTDLQSALDLFVTEVRKYDKNIPISSGNGHPRRYAYNNTHYNSWALDSDAETRYMIDVSHPSGVDLVSVHLYPDHKKKLGYSQKSGELSYEDILSRVEEVASDTNKVVFVGEFGVTSGSRFSGDEVQEFNLLMESIYNSGVSLAALWVYRFNYQKNTYDVRQNNAREYQIRTLMHFNNKLRAKRELCSF